MGDLRGTRRTASQDFRAAKYLEMVQALELHILTQQSELDLPQADDIKINDMGPVIRPTGDVVELAQMNLRLSAARPLARYLS